MRFRLVLSVTFLALWFATTITAITNGTVDTTNTFRNTGAFIVKHNPSGQIFPICSGTLIAPGVFLTASHCTIFFQNDLASLNYSAFVSFDNPIPFGGLTSGATHLIPVTQVVTNPLYSQRQNDSGDIGLLLVSSANTVGITPAQLPTAGLLDELQAKNGLRNAVFIAVGYGLQDRSTGGGQPTFQDQNPVPRRYAFSAFDALNPGYIRLSQNPTIGDGGTCYGDSGGPNFLNGGDGSRILAALTVTGDTACRATNVDYRLDTPSARQFLSPYVTLP
jgi:trypsin